MAQKGQNLRVFVGGKCIAAATSCQFHVAVSTEDSSTKDSTGDWAENSATGKSWDASCDALVVFDSDDSGNVMTDIFSKIGDTVTLVFQTTSSTSTKNREATTTFTKTGQAILSDISITAANRQNSTYTVQFTGTGSLA